MKKLMLFLLLAFFVGVTQSSAKQYCGENINGVSVTCVKDGSNYVMTFEGTGFNGLGGTFYNPGGVDLRTNLTENTETKIVCTLNVAPNFYTPIYIVKKAGGEYSFSLSDIEWVTSCGGGEEPVPTASNYCQTPIQSNDGLASVMLTCTKVSDGNYQIVFEGENLNGLGGSFYNPGAIDIRNNITSSTSTKIVCDIAASSSPTLYTPLYVLMPGEKVFTWPNDIVWGQCSSSPVSDLEDPELTITDPSAAAIELAIDATKQITWTSSNTATPTFTSSKESVAIVSDAGVITAKAIGSATITVKQAETDTYQEATKTITVTVPGDKSKNTECSGWNDDMWASEGGYIYDFSTTATDVVLKITAMGEFPVGMVSSPEMLFIRRDGGDGIEGGGVVSGKTITWTFSKTSVLTRDGNPYLFNDNTIHFMPRIVRQNGIDQTNVIIYTVGEDCQEHPVTGVSITSTFTELVVGQSMTMTAEVTPANATNKNVTWSITSGSEYASINYAGTVTGIAAGDITVQVETEDGEFTATKTITIKAGAVDPKTYNAYGKADGVYVLYSITYNADQTLTYVVQIDHNKMGLVPQVNVKGNEVYKDLSLKDGKYQFTTTETFTSGTVLNDGFFYFPYSGGSTRIDFDYTVGAENEMPIISVEALDVTPTSISFAKNDPDYQLTATKHPSFATGDVSWTTGSDAVATVTNGLVHPVADGETTITATCGSKSAVCNVTVQLTELEPTIYYVVGEDKEISAMMTITRNADHKLTYSVEAIQEKENFTVQINDGDFRNTTVQGDKYVYTSASTYLDGATVNGFIYMPFTGDAGRIDFTYIVGAENVLISEKWDNTERIEATATKTTNAFLDRTFIADGYNYTLCLPFDMTADQCLDAFGSNYKLWELGVAYMKTPDVMYLPFSEVTSIEAGKPYLFCPAADVVNPTIEGVTINAAAPVAQGNDYAKMTGIYSPYELPIENNYILGPDNWLYQSAGDTMLGLRCYFTFGSAAPAGVRARAIFHDTDVVTNLETIDAQCPMSNGKYVIDGQFVIIRNGKQYNAVGQER